MRMPLISPFRRVTARYSLLPYPLVRQSAVLGLAMLLSSCVSQPVPPDLSFHVPAQFKENQAWVSAAPADALPRGAWWHIYQLPALDALEQRLNENNSSLAAAAAHYRQAEAYSQQLRAARSPSLDLSGTASTLRQSINRPIRGATMPTYYNDFVVGAQASYEVDLWGRVRNLVASGKSAAEAEKANLASVQLSLQTELAQTYFMLCGMDAQADILRQSIAAYTKSLALTQNRLENGIASALDVARASTLLEQTKGQLEQLLAQRAVAEHAIAALVGSNVSDFSLPPTQVDWQVPVLPVGVPSTLLQRRPDIAAAQRNVEAATASLGVAKSAYYPSLTLSGLLGYESGSMGNLLTSPSLLWAFGPALAVNVFDGGKRKSQVAQAQAVLDQTVANYRTTVITAFQQVEDSLSTIDHLGKAAASEKLATEAADKALRISTSRYQLGGASYLEVTTSQLTALQAQRNLIASNTSLSVASVSLVRALGGGWQAEPAP